MIYGAINQKGEKYYTDLNKIFDFINNKQIEYNWLITDCDCYPYNYVTDEILRKGYCWISGEKLTEIVEKEAYQWIWAVLSGFEKTVEIDDVLKYSLPYADGYPGFWKNPLTLQHPLAKIEIVPWDSTLTLILSEEKEIIDAFRKYFRESEDLAEHNSKL